MLAVRAVNASCRRWDSCWIRDRSAVESTGGSETFDTILILFATLLVYHFR